MIRSACLSRGRGRAGALRVWVRVLRVMRRVVASGGAKGRGWVYWREAALVDSPAARARLGVPDLGGGRHRRAAGAIPEVLSGALEAWDRLA